MYEAFFALFKCSFIDQVNRCVKVQPLPGSN